MSNAIQLLVSVRDMQEASAALAGGAALIDVKEPAHGSLGAADPGVLADVLATVAGRAPVSCALGEIGEGRCQVPKGVAFVKWGLAQQQDTLWRDTWLSLARRTSAHPVVVAYADWQCAQAPAVEEVVAFACRQPDGVLLIDTHCKTATVEGRRAHLLDWLTFADLKAIREQCRRSGTRLALAGSLGIAQIEELLPLCPDWFAVRGAACTAGDRTASVCEQRVRELVRLM